MISWILEQPLGFQLAQTLALHLYTQDQSSLAPITIRDFPQFHNIAAEHHLLVQHTAW